MKFMVIYAASNPSLIFLFLRKEFILKSCIIIEVRMSSIEQHNTLLVIKLILAEKLQLDSAGIPSTAKLSELVQGNSAVQNEIMGILLKELKLSDAAAETVPEKPLEMVAQENPSSSLGPWGVRSVSKFLQTSLTGLSTDLSEQIPGITSEQTSNFWLQAMDNQPENKLNQEQSEGWVQSFGSKLGLVKAQEQQQSSGGGGGGMTKQEKKKMQQLYKFQQAQAKLYQDTFGSKHEESAGADISPELVTLQEELGTEFIQGIQPSFTKEKIRTYNSWWNWHRTPGNAHYDGFSVNTPPMGPVTDEQGRFSLEPRDTTYSNFYKGCNLRVDALDNSFRTADATMTAALNDTLQDLLTNGLQTRKRILVTGAGRGSIGQEIATIFLRAGADVVVTTSRAKYDSWRDLYHANCGKNSSLTVIPSNMCSKQDVASVMKHVLTTGHLDMVFPFAAFTQFGRMSQIGSKQELAYRLMATNVTRLVGAIGAFNRANKGRLTQVVLPFSPNVGVFGGDGLYAESKFSMLAIMNKLKPEGWYPGVSAVAAEIGWTRSTLMAAHNIVAQGIEQNGVVTFDTKEMALLVIATGLSCAYSEGSLVADLTSGFGALEDFGGLLASLRQKIPVYKPASQDTRKQRLTYDSGFPEVSANKDAQKIPVDLSTAVVCVGFGEVSPWGNQSTRWDVEKNATLSVESILHLAWLTGLVSYESGKGWVDADSGDVVTATDILPRYEETVMSNAGIRMIDPESMTDGYDPNKHTVYTKCIIEEKLGPVTVLEEDLYHYKNVYGDQVEVGPGNTVTFLPGAEIRVMKSLPKMHKVGAPLPKGWDPKRLGVPENIVRQIDPMTTFALCALSEAFISAGMEDPYEMYRYIHFKDVGNCIGTGIGGMNALYKCFHMRDMDEPVQSDILQEMLLNVMPAWLNMLILGACGPIKTPVQACASAAVSIEMGCDLIKQKKSKVVIVGGSEDMGKMGMTEFANMGATNPSTEDFACGRRPNEMSRPTTDTRSGFVESCGAGIQILMTAEVALEMGLPIYAVVAHTHTACDKINRSVPAPGRGILTSIAESPVENNPLLDPRYRFSKAEQWIQSGVPENVANRHWSTGCFKETQTVSPLRAGMAAWNIPEISAISFHGTSTKGNDENESFVNNMLLTHLGNVGPKPVVCQKHLTGHSKGAAAGFMANGAMQMLRDQYVPGNHQADNIDPDFKSNQHLVYPRNGYASKVESVLLHSFGFGQAGAQILLAHPHYLFDQLDEEALRIYRGKRGHREMATFRRRQDVLHGSVPLVQIKDTPAFDDLDAAYVDVNARYMGAATTHKPKQSLPTSSQGVKVGKQAALKFVESQPTEDKGIGTDIQKISELGLSEPTFIARNFTLAERIYCELPGKREQRYGGRWAAKEAAIKALSSLQPDVVKSAWHDLRNIEVVNDENGKPHLKFHGALSDLCSKAEVSISHSGDYAMAVVRLEA
jgi:fatty acid synthase subunit alpha